jgi:signal peptidase
MIVNIVTIFVIVLIALMLFTSLATQRGHSLLGIRSYIVLSDSMRPAVSTGSYIIVQEKQTKDIQIGDVISFYMSDGVTVLTHRVVEKIEKDGAISFITQGDANDSPDGHPVESERVLGTMLFALTGVGSFLLSLRQPFSLIICIFILIVIFLTPEVYRFFRKSAQPKARPEPEGDALHNDITYDETLSVEAFLCTEAPMAVEASLPIGRAKRRGKKGKNATEGETPLADAGAQTHEEIERPALEKVSRKYDEAIIVDGPPIREAAPSDLPVVTGFPEIKEPPQKRERQRRKPEEAKTEEKRRYASRHTHRSKRRHTNGKATRASRDPQRRRSPRD